MTGYALQQVGSVVYLDGYMYPVLGWDKKGYSFTVDVRLAHVFMRALMDNQRVNGHYPIRSVSSSRDGEPVEVTLA